MTNYFSPITVKDMELKNRIVLPAMGTKFSGKDSYVTPRLIGYHVARVKRRMRFEYGGSVQRTYAQRAPGLPLYQRGSVHSGSERADGRDP